MLALLRYCYALGSFSSRSRRMERATQRDVKADMRTPLQLWLADLERGELPAGRRPLIIPIVFFNGRKPWTVPRSIPDIIAVPEGLEHLARNFGISALHDISRRAPDDISSRTDVRSALLALAFAKEITRQRPMRWWWRLTTSSSGATNGVRVRRSPIRAGF